jgi:hypothetical protein
VLGPSADAARTDRSVSAAAAARAADSLDCNTQIVGVNAQRKLVFKTVHNNDLTRTKVTGQRLPFDPSGMEFYQYQPIRNGYDLSVTAVRPQGRPQVLTVRQLNGKRLMSYTAKPMLNKSFTAPLYAGSGGYYVFSASTSGTIRRWTTFRNDHGGVSFGKPQIVLQGLRGITTLAFANRVKVNGVRNDVLYATGRHGALYQVQVPITERERTHVKTVVTTGFRGTTDLSLSTCNGHVSKLSIVAINATDDKATWFTLTDQLAPRAGNLTDRGGVAEGTDWVLHATF